MLLQLKAQQLLNLVIPLQTFLLSAVVYRIIIKSLILHPVLCSVVVMLIWVATYFTLHLAVVQNTFELKRHYPFWK